MEMSIPCGVCAKISSVRNLWSDQNGHREDTKTTMPAERSRNYRSRSVPRSYPYASSIPPKYSVSQIMGYLKGKSSLMIFDQHANLKYKYGNRHFWARGYYVDTVGRNKKQVQEYIRNQLQEDQIAYQMSIKEYVDPFTGRENK